MPLGHLICSFPYPQLLVSLFVFLTKMYPPIFSMYSPRCLHDFPKQEAEVRFEVFGPDNKRVILYYVLWLLLF